MSILVLLVVVTSPACSLFPSSEIRRGDHHFAAGNWEGALLAYKQALKDDPFDSSLQNKYAMAKERSAASYQGRGRMFMKEGQVDLALESFKRALAMDPANTEYQTSFNEALRLKESRSHFREADRLAQLGRTDEALQGFAKAAELDPSFAPALENITRLTEDQQAALREDRHKQPVTLRFRNAGLREVLEGLAKAGSLNLIFDKDVRNDPVTISIQDTPFDEALALVLNSNNLFSRPAGPDTLIISPNTRQKQEQYQDLMIRTFYLSNAKAKDMLVLLKSILDSKRMHANEQLNTIVIRDQPEKLDLAEKIILANDRQEAEVLFDVEVLEVNRTKNQTYGLNFPKQAGMGLVPPGFTGALTVDPQQFTYRQLTSLGPDSYIFRLPTSLLLDFFKQEADAKTLAAPKVRVVNNKKAEVNIGDKQPILLSTTNVLPGQAATGAVPTTSTVTSIEFRDTGVKLTVEPSIHLANELSLKMKIEVIRIGDLVTLQASPPIQQFRFGNRTAETILNIKDGETIVLGGLIQEEDRRTRQTVPWLGDLPIIGNLLSSFRTDRVTTEVILTITPHIIQPITPSALPAQAFWSGTDAFYATNPLFPGKSRKESIPVMVPRNDRLVPAQTAEAEGTRRPTSGVMLLPPPNQSPASLSLQPNEAIVPLGKMVKMDLVAEHLQGLREGTLKVDYDPDVLEFRSAAEGDLLKEQIKPRGVDVSTNISQGKVRITLRKGGRPLVGDGSLASLTFATKAPGVSAVHVELLARSSEREEDPVHTGESTSLVRVR
jgi:general secretion pathway protein D